MHLQVFLLLALAQLSVAPKPNPVVECGRVHNIHDDYMATVEHELKNRNDLTNLRRLGACNTTNSCYVIFLAKTSTGKEKMFCIKITGTKDKNLITDYKIMKGLAWWDSVDYLKDNQIIWKGIYHAGYSNNKSNLKSMVEALAKRYIKEDNLTFAAVDYGFRHHKTYGIIHAAIYRVEEKINLTATNEVATIFIRVEYNATILSEGKMIDSPQLLLKKEIVKELDERNEILETTSVAQPKKESAQYESSLHQTTE